MVEVSERYCLKLIKNGKRVDGRDLLEFREIEIIPGIIKNAEGSASVKIGNTHVIVGVKIELAKPFPDSPNEGVLKVSAEFAPLASPEFEAGPPGEEAIELARVVDRAIRSAEAIELKKLFIEEGKVWGVFIDLHIINNNGNLIDASSLAAITALLNAKIPKLEGETVIREYEKGLSVVHKPVIVTVCKVGDKLFVDPNHLEENILDSKISIGIREDNLICAIQKQGKVVKFDEIKEIIDIALEKSKELRKLCQ
jgi:exosome complex component RRP42